MWCLFTIRALFYCTVFPVWEGFDEYSHFAAIQHIALHKDLPDERTANTSRQVARSLQLVPVSWMIHNSGAGLLSYEDYWRLPGTERESREREFHGLAAEPPDREAEPRLALYEAQQAPLYYWLMAPLYLLLKRADLAATVWVLRCVGALIASLIIPFGFLTARRVFASDAMALGVAVVMASMPQVLINASRVGNEGLAMAVGSLVTMLALRLSDSAASRKEAALFGLSVGAALLTKAYFLAVLPLMAAVLVLGWKGHRQVAPAALSCAICFAVAGWWYAHNLLVMGTLTGEQTAVAMHVSSGASLWTTARRMPWLRVLDFLALSHIWLGNWSFLVVRSWMYRVVEVVCAVALCGILVRGTQRRYLSLLALPCLVLIPGLCYHAALSWQVSGEGASMGYYLYCCVASEVVLLLAGAFRLCSFAAVLLFTTLFSALELFGTWFLMLPYYAGMIQHDPQGNLPAFHLQQLAEGGFATLFGRLLANKPDFITFDVLAGLAAPSIACSVTLLAIAFALTIRGEKLAV